MHPHQLRVAFTHDQRKIIFINFTRNNFSVRENLSIHTIACHEGVGPEILFGPNDLFATQLHGQVCIYNSNYPDGTIITKAFVPFDRPLEDTSAETLTLDRQMHQQCTDICSMKFNPDPLNEQLVVHRNNELSIVNPRTTEVQIKIKNTQPISSFTRRGNCLAYLNNNGEVVTLDTESLEPHKLITLLKPILQMSFCPFSNPLLMIFCGNHDKKSITVYDIYQGKVLEKKGPHFEKVTWVPNTTIISAFTSSEEGNSSLTQWDLDQASATYLYAQQDHGEFNLDKTRFFDRLIWQVNNNQILELQNGQDLDQIFSQFPDNVKNELVAAGKIVLIQPNLLPEDQDEPNYGETPPPAYEDIFLDQVIPEDNASITDPVVVANPQQRPSRFQRFLAFIHLRRLQNHH